MILRAGLPLLRGERGGALRYTLRHVSSRRIVDVLLLGLSSKKNASPPTAVSILSIFFFCNVV